MIISSQCLQRRERAYNMSLTVFMIFLIACQLIMFRTIIEGATIEYGDEFYRKIYVQNPMVGKTETLLDDGSYEVKNGTLMN